MNHNKIAVRYTKALYELASEQNVLEAVYSDVLLIGQLFKDSADFAALAQNPVVPASKKAKAFSAVLNGHVNNLTIRFVEMVVQNKREMYFREIVNHFTEKYRLQKGIKKVDIVSAVPLEQQTKQKLSSLISSTKGVTQVIIEEAIDTELIGGFIIKVEDLQLDASVKSKLNKVKRGLLNASL